MTQCKQIFLSIMMTLMALAFLMTPPPLLSAANWMLYVTNSSDGTVSVIDTSTNTVVMTIPAVGSEPYGIAITPDGKTAYVVDDFNSDNPGTVTPIDLMTNRVGSPIGVGSGPQFIAITPDGKTAYVTNQDSYNVSVIDIMSNTVIGPSIGVGSNPVGIAIAPNGKMAYVANLLGKSVTPINLMTNNPETSISISGFPLLIAITPDGTTAYVANNNNNVTPIDLLTNIPGSSISVAAGGLSGIAITPDGRTAYVTNDNDNHVHSIDIATNTPGSSIPVVVEPFGIAITPDGRTAYVVNAGEDTVTPIDLLTNTLGLPIPVGAEPQYCAITPDQAPIASFVFGESIAGSRTQFNASASTTLYGTIANYNWNFGDGTPPVNTASPLINHTFRNSGNFVVTLTVTNSAGTSTEQVFTGQTMSRNGGPSAINAQNVVSIFKAPVFHFKKPLPPSDFTGIFKKQYILRKKCELVLVSSWKPSRSPDIVCYHIYLKDKRVSKIDAGSRLSFKKLIRSKREARKLSIAAVSAGDLESDRVKIKIKK